MEAKICGVCSQNQTEISCDQCHQPTCKTCSYFIDEDSFEDISLLPDSIRFKTFCQSCYVASVSETLDSYKKIYEKAKNIDVYMKNQSTETRLIRRIERPISVKDCDDRDEVMMRLAFATAKMGFTRMVDVDIYYTKVVKGTYKKHLWSGSATPV